MIQILYIYYFVHLLTDYQPCPAHANTVCCFILGLEMEINEMNGKGRNNLAYKGHQEKFGLKFREAYSS